MFNYVGSLVQLPCGQKNYLAGAAGAGVAYLGYETMFPLPKLAHYAAAGLVIDVLCRGPMGALSGPMEAGYSMGAGLVGAAIVGALGFGKATNILKMM